MKKYKKIELFLLAVSLLTLLIATKVSAQFNIPNKVGPAGNEINLITTNETPDTIIQNALGWFFLIAGLLCIIIIIWAGISYATAGGDEEKVGKAKTRLIYGIIGVAVIIGSYIITQIIQSAITGNLTPNI